MRSNLKSVVLLTFLIIGLAPTSMNTTLTTSHQSLVFAQTESWNKTYDFGLRDYITKVIERRNGGYAILGDIDWNPTFYNVSNFLFQVDENGNQLWPVEYYQDDLRYRDFIEREEGGFIIVGNDDNNIVLVDAYGNGTGVLRKSYTLEGYEDARPYQVKQIVNTGFMILGTAFNTVTESPDWILLRTDHDGNALGYHAFPREMSVMKVIQSNSNDFVLFCRIGSEYGVLKIDSSTLNQTYIPLEFTTDNVDTHMAEVDVIECSSGGYLISTTAYDIHPYLSSKPYFRILRYCNNGSQIWNQTLEPAYYYSWSKSVIEMRSGGFIISGHGSPYNTSDVFLLVRTNENGSLLWQKEFEGPVVEEMGYEIPFLIEDKSGGILLSSIIGDHEEGIDIKLIWTPDAPFPATSTSTTTSSSTSSSLANSIKYQNLLLMGISGAVIFAVVLLVIDKRLKRRN